MSSMACCVSLDSELLNSYPEGYRHLAYLQTQLGLHVSIAPHRYKISCYRPLVRGFIRLGRN